jgi:IS30 family transposase
LLAGAAKIATLVVRHSSFVMLLRLRGKDTNNVVAALSRTVRAPPTGLMSSLTSHRGMEVATHKTFTVATGL